MARDPWPWSLLGLEPDASGREVRRAYATRLKVLDPSDVEAFQALRQAYEAALSEAGQPAPEPEREPVPPDTGAAAPGQGAWRDEALTLRPDPSLGRALAHKALQAEMMHKLRAGVFDPAIWEPLFASPLLEDALFARVVEEEIVAELETSRLMPPVAWMGLADARFGWRLDGVAFERRFPAALHLRAFLVAMAQPPAPRPAPLPSKRSVIVATLGLVLAVTALGEVMDSRIPLQVLSSLAWALLGTLVFLAAWAAGLGRLALGLAGLGAGGAARHAALLRWIQGGSSPGRRWQGFLLGLTCVFWVVIMLGFTDFQSHPQPRIGSREIEASVLAQQGALHLPWTGLRAEVGGDVRQMQPRLAWGAEPGAPEAMIICPKLPENRLDALCSLRVILPATMARAVQIAAGQEADDIYMEILHNPTLEESLLLPGGPSILGLSQDAGGGGLDAPAADLGKMEGLDLFPRQLPTDAAADPDQGWIALDWPEAQTLADDIFAACAARLRRSKDSDPANLDAICKPGPVDALPLRQLDCGAGAEPKACALRLLTETAALQGRAPLRLDLGAPRIALMRDLLRRMSSPGQHPPLPALPEILAMRDQVLRDYALLLDRPEAEARRRDPAAIRAALGRQPHLAQAYRAGRALRAATWTALLDAMARLGFDVTEARARPG